MGNIISKKTYKNKNEEVQQNCNISLNSSKSSKSYNNRIFYNSEEIPYILPKDNIEMQRLTDQHYIIKYLYGKNFHNSIKPLLIDGCNVLDIGCGTGIWCLEMCTTFYNSKFVGIDVSINEKNHNIIDATPKEIKPSNVEFKNVDVLINPLPFEDSSFDYIHMQMMVFAIPKDKWNIVINEIIRILKPGGYIQFVELDGVTYHEINEKGEVKFLKDDFQIKALEIIKKNTSFISSIPVKIKNILENNNLIEEIEYKTYSSPIGWNKKGIDENIKNMMFTNVKDAYKAIYPILGPSMHLDEISYINKLNIFLEKCKSEKGVWIWHWFTYKKK